MVSSVGVNRIRPVLHYPDTAFRATDATDLRLCPRLPSLRSVLPSRQGDVSGKIISKTWIHSRYCLPGREMCQVAVTWNLKLETWNVRQHLETHEIHITLSRINIANTKTGRMRFAPTLINLKPPFLGKIWSNFDLLTQKGEKSSKNV